MTTTLEDLSDYEKQRLANIQRNAQFLASHGIEAVKPPAAKSAQSKKKVDNLHNEMVREKRKYSKEKTWHPEQPIRRSRRVMAIEEQQQQQDIGKDEAEARVGSDDTDDEDDGTIHYDVIPEESSQLDDMEFQVYTDLKRWRLLTSRELDIEPYKVMQNRTICDIIRRRRNDALWATPYASSSAAVNNSSASESQSMICKPSDGEALAAITSSTTGSVISSTNKDNLSQERKTPVGNNHDAESNAKPTDMVCPNDTVGDSVLLLDEEAGETKIMTDLLLVWGIGPSKARKEGFGWLALDVLAREKNTQHLAESRQLVPVLAVDEKEQGQGKQS